MNKKLIEGKCKHQYRKENDPYLYCALFEYPVICACVGYEEYCDSFEPRDNKEVSENELCVPKEET